MSTGTIIEVSASNFREVVLNAEKMTLIKFYFEACKPCKELNPILDELAQEFSDCLVIGSLDIEESKENNKVFKNYGGHYAPTMLLFHEGLLKKKLKGRTLEELRKELSELKAV
ncbi:thioredoxin family protein [Brevibacillus reuszeri]|uniref:thioredoxin family protein n=1 Tax=Brevibacillus reuszeri TaxID=54915 RepID=UPI00289C74AB|nr:thioredoxin domain-containing protein [Brevibacillus reuszeri]